MTPLQFEPDSQYQYSNAGINTAGRIIEVVSGMPYEEFMQKRLFDPLGMKDTTFWPTRGAGEAAGEVVQARQGQQGPGGNPHRAAIYPLTDPKRQPFPAGGLFSTASDVGVFCQMILNGGTYKGKQYLSEEAVRADDLHADRRPAEQGQGRERLRPGLVRPRRKARRRRRSSPARAATAGPTPRTCGSTRSTQLITVFMVQHAGPGGEGGKAQRGVREGGGGGVSEVIRPDPETNRKLMRARQRKPFPK